MRGITIKNGDEVVPKLWLNYYKKSDWKIFSVFYE